MGHIKRVFFLSLFLLSHNIFSAKLPSAIKVHTGMVNGSYSNPLTFSTAEITGESNVKNTLVSGFSVLPSIDLVYESYQTIRKSYFARTTICMSLATGVMHYHYLGFGMNKYFQGLSIPRFFSDEKTSYSVSPQTSLYWGIDVGMSRVSVLQFGTALTAVSSALDFGGHGGMTKKFGDKLSFNAELGASFAYGFTNIAVTGVNVKILFGLSYPL